MIGVVLCLMPGDIAAKDFLSFWLSDTIWFVIACFIFGVIVEVSGLAKRLAIYILSIRSLLLMDLAFFVVNIVFALAGMATTFTKIVILFPILISIATLSGLSKLDPIVKHIALGINILGHLTGLFVLTGFIWNPVMASLGGIKVGYVTWIQWFFVPVLLVNLVTLVVIYLVFLPRSAKRFDLEVVKQERTKLGPITSNELKTIAWLIVAVLFWSTADLTKIPMGFSAVLVAGLMMLPRIGLVTFRQFIEKTDWNVVFFIMGIQAIGSLGATGFSKWIWSLILPAQMPSNGMVSLMLMSFLVEILHVPLGSIGTTTALAIPSLAAHAQVMGMSSIVVSFVSYLCIVGQSFFVYQNATLVVGQAFGLWEAKDIMKLGIVMFFVLPITLGVLLYPWWLFMGWV